MKISRLVPTGLLTVALLLGTAMSPGASLGQKSAKWGYEGDIGPKNWAQLSPDYKACAGSQQSPINLTNATSAKKPSFQLEYETAKAEVTDTGKSIQVNTKGGTLTIKGTTYNLLQFHVHTPSEHTVDGEHYPAEIHFVHKAEDGNLAVLAAFVEEGGTANPALNGWIKGNSMTMKYDASALLPSSALLPTERSYYTYQGSLTTPPCSEIVTWVVLATPIQASSDQLNTLRSHYKGNNRPVQPLNDRTIKFISSK